MIKETYCSALTKMALCNCLFCLFLNTSAQNLTNTRVANFQGNSMAAITYSLDDGLSDQFSLAVPMLEKYGFRGTFFIIASLIPETREEALAKKEGSWGGIAWQDLRTMANNGHEIGNHSLTHKNLKKMNEKLLDPEINQSYELIRKNLGIPPHVFCYPYNSFDENIRNMALKNHIATRDSTKGVGSKSTTESLNAIVDNAIRKNRWEVLMIHGIAKGFDAFTSPEVLDNHFSYVSKLGDKVWVSTFYNVVRYIRERDNTKIETKYSRKKAIVKVSTTLNSDIYNYPLTLILDKDNTTKIMAEQSNKKLYIKEDDNCVYIDVLPNSKPIVIKWQ